MPRKLKTYITRAGFFEQAVAAPSMKAAIDAWGSAKNIFQQGFAEEIDDPAIIAATMEKPGVVLKRAVGSKGPFTEHAELPKSLPAGRSIPRPKPKRRSKKAAKAKKEKSASIVSLADAREAKQAAVRYEKERARQEKEQAREEEKQQKARDKRDEAMARAEEALDKARKSHDATRAAIMKAREALDHRDEAEETRWEKEKEKLKTELNRAGD
jgi:colicin import membrane protein